MPINSNYFRTNGDFGNNLYVKTANGIQAISLIKDYLGADLNKLGSGYSNTGEAAQAAKAKLLLEKGIDYNSLPVYTPGNNEKINWQSNPGSFFSQPSIAVPAADRYGNAPITQDPSLAGYRNPNANYDYAAKPLAFGTSQLMTREQQLEDIKQKAISIREQIPTATGLEQPDLSQFDRMFESIIEDTIKSGKTINPDITSEQLANIDPAVFLQQAENSLAPEYKEKFGVIKESLSRELSNIGYDLNLKKSSIARETQANLDKGTEDLAGRGLAFSGARSTFETQTADTAARAAEASRVEAFRKAQDLGSSAESQVGTSALRDFNAPTIDGRAPFQFASTPVTGSLVSEKQFLKEGLARELETQERSRRAFATRSLSFA